MITLIRVAAILCVIGLKTHVPRIYTSLFIAVLFSHYVLSFWYSRRRARSLVAGQVPPHVLFVVAAACAILPFVAIPPLVLYFGFHHALTEGYMLAGKPGGPATPDGPVRRLLTGRMVLAGAVYAFVLCRSDIFSKFPHQALMVLVGVTFVVFIALLALAARHIERREVVETITFEVVGVGASLLTLLAPISFNDVVFYHLVVWILLPLKQLPSARGKLTFLAQTAALSIAFFCLTPSVHWFPSLTGGFWLQQSEFWAYIHITATFALSSLNPRCITRWFVPRTLVPAVQ